jgi:hypothetical protein
MNLPAKVMAVDWSNPDFGPDGMMGITDSQKKELSGGKIVFSTTDKGRESSLIEAAIVFDKPPEEVWSLLSNTEGQIKYLKEIKKLRLIERNGSSDTIWFQLSIMLIPIKYQINHHYNKDNLYFYWGLDPSYKNDLKDLKGFWKFYPYENNKTFARYGSLVSLKYVPSWLQEAFKKKAVEKALVSVKCYVDSGGTCRRKGY